ncbi:MAG: glycosyltransferase family 4 protein, partial [Halieaceae bacterium]|nr:glycosyltransferase family 4 protein [Halieaceae bacterium]
MPVISLSANTSWYLYNFRAATIRALQKERFDVACVSPEDAYSRRLAEELGCRWLPLAMNNQGSNPLAETGLVYRFRRHYQRLRPAAALHFTIKNNVYGTWAARSLGIPAINNVSGLGTAFIHPGLTGGIVRLLYRTSMPLAHRVFCQNEEDRRLLLDTGLVPGRRLQLVPGSGVDLQRFQPTARAAEQDRFRFLFAGRMLADKGLHELVAAMRAINRDRVRCELWLSGFPGVSNVSAISEQQLEDLGRLPGVRWLGPSDRMERLYAQVDCVVLPSYREGIPRSVLEAGAMGLPCVVTDVPGCRSVITHGENGL